MEEGGGRGRRKEGESEERDGEEEKRGGERDREAKDSLTSSHAPSKKKRLISISNVWRHPVFSREMGGRAP